MAVAVKNASEAPPHSLFDRLAVSSLLGVLYVLGSIGIVYYGIHLLWTRAAASIGMNLLASLALEQFLMLGGLIGLAFLGRTLLGPNPPHGLRAGIGVG